ncbi:MAG: radical SAM protein [Sedimentisphaerales bacterium]|jgi:predicted DNA-binding helix-hairpin-helix protein
MTAVISVPDTQQKLEILSADAQYDLACACGCKNDERRRRGAQGNWIYPVTLPNGGTSVLFKTLVSNVCSNDCKYCPLRANQDVRRCTLNEEETVNAFLDYHKRGEVFGLFLSSGILGTPDATMERLNRIAKILRYRRNYRGYIHLKVIPGASANAIEEAVKLSSAVSLNIETPGAKYLAKLSDKKRFIEDIVEPIKLISRLTGRGNKYHRVKQTTQFIVGAADETDSEIVKYMWGLYDRLNLRRIYFSAYQKLDNNDSGNLFTSRQYFQSEMENRKTNTERSLPAVSLAGDVSASEIENIKYKIENSFVREHRLYQVDFLLRKYGFSESDIIFDQQGNLPLDTDPKESWAKRNPQYFPVDINKASKDELLRVPGLGQISVERILELRKSAKIKSISDLGKSTILLTKATDYLAF